MMNNFNNFGFPQNKNIYTDQLNNPNGIGFDNNTYMPPTKPMGYDGFYSSQTQQQPSFWDKTKAFFSQNGGTIVKWAIGGFMTLGALIGVNKFIKTDVPYGKGHGLKEDGRLMEKIKYIQINTKTQIITPTQKGEYIYDIVKMSMPDMLNPKLTASWEKGLDMVAKKEIKGDIFMQKLEDYINSKFDKLVIRK